MLDNETIGNRIKELREKKGLTQQQFAELLHVSREKVVKIENGTRGLQIHDISLIAEELQTTCDYIIRGVDTKNLAMYDELGLSNLAINHLKEICDRTKENDRGFVGSEVSFNALDFFLRKDQPGIDILALIYEYLLADFDVLLVYQSIEDKRNREIAAIPVESAHINHELFASAEGCQYMDFPLTSGDLSSMALQKIMDKLKRWREELKTE